MTPYEIDLLNYMIVSNLIFEKFLEFKKFINFFINYFQSIFQHM
jgi:hypothetical protein